MPIHDWSRVDANLFHDFHQSWTVELCRQLNAGLLPPGYSALVEPSGGALPGVERIIRTKADDLAARANRVTIRYRLGRAASVIEVVSPGIKGGRAGLRGFVEHTHEFWSAGVNVLVVDLFPPTPFDPFGIHQAIWDTFAKEAFELPTDRPLILASYNAASPTAGGSVAAWVESVAVGLVLPDMPMFLGPDTYVPIPLERTYQAAWDSCPADMRYLVEHGHLPDEG